jgi:hypothetical protein
METPESSQWPIVSMLSYGTFGMKTPAGRRYHLRSAFVLVALLIFWPLTFFLWWFETGPSLLWRAIAGLAPGLAVSYIAWEARRYWLSLDELARRLQLEAAAYSYLVACVASTLFGGLSFIFIGHSWAWLWCNPLWVFVIAEPVRGVILYFLARRY